jgi:hypothetical protein
MMVKLNLFAAALVDLLRHGSDALQTLKKCANTDDPHT